MSVQAYEAYRSNSILEAQPVELVCLLYRGAIASVDRARASLAGGDRAARANHVTRVQEIVVELASSVNLAEGGEIAGRLAELYLYMQQRMQTAHFEESDGPLAEVRNLLSVLLEAWEANRAAAVASPGVPGGIAVAAPAMLEGEPSGYSVPGL